uniref:Pre-mRNA 3'-end-processing factor FIP1 n=1 Tax=Takifugu rubripes TaxID=31033 RepID=H2RTS9_TAKRU
MSAEEADKTATTDHVGIDMWLRLPCLNSPAYGDGDSDSESDDDDDDVRVTIGDIKTGDGGTDELNESHDSSAFYVPATKLKGIDLDAPGNINGVPVVDVDMESFEEKPWRKPGADLSDYFNYGFNEDTWKAYCEKQKRLRMGLEVSSVGSVASKITVQQGRTGNEKDVSSVPVLTSKPDFASPVSQYKSASSGTIDVIGGQTATISRVEGRRRHNLDGNNIQVIAEQSDAEAPAAKIPSFFPPGPLPPNIPPPPFLPPPPSVSAAPPLIPPPSNSGHAGGYDGRSVPSYTFPQGAYPPPMTGGVPPPWPHMMDNSKSWDYYSRREDKRDKERERPRERTHEREREREHSPSAMSYTSDEERYRYREYQERAYGERHRDRSSREKEERHRERRHRDKEEGRHKSSRSSSRRRHDSEEGDSHRRHKHKKSKRSKEGKEASEDASAEQENQDAME